MNNIRQNTWLFIYGFLLCFLPIASVMSGNGYGTAPVAGFFLGLLVFLTGERKPVTVDMPLLCTVTALPLLAATSSLWGMDSGKIISKALKETVVFISGFSLITLASQLSDASRARILKLFIYSFILTALFLYSELVFNHPVFRFIKQISFNEKVIASVVNHAAVALSLLYWPFLYLHLQKNDPRETRFAVMSGAFILIFVVIFSQSETAMVAGVAGAITFMVAKYFPKATFWIAAVKTTLVSLTAPFIFPLFYQTLAPALSEWRSANASARLDIWNTVSEYALRNPLYGHGMEASRNITDFTFGPFYAVRTYISHPHNNILQLWIEFGALGALWAAAFFIFVLLRMRKLPPREYTTAFASFAAAFTVALVGYGLWQAWWAGLAFMLVVTLKISFLQKRDKN